jgi:transcriptional regulator with XRE-family HTH domain
MARMTPDQEHPLWTPRRAAARQAVGSFLPTSTNISQGKCRLNTADTHPIDKLVGARIRQRRRERGMSQMLIAEKIGLTFQQIQKYERGGNRVSASKLYQIAQVLETPVEWFFPAIVTDAERTPVLDSAVHSAELVKSIEIAAVWNRVPNRTRQLVLSFLKNMAADEETSAPSEASPTH